MNFLGIFNRDEEESERARGDQDAEGSIPGLWLQGRGQHKQVGKWCSWALVRQTNKQPQSWNKRHRTAGLMTFAKILTRWHSFYKCCNRTQMRVAFLNTGSISSPEVNPSCGKCKLENFFLTRWTRCSENWTLRTAGMLILRTFSGRMNFKKSFFNPPNILRWQLVIFLGCSSTFLMPRLRLFRDVSSYEGHTKDLIPFSRAIFVRVRQYRSTWPAHFPAKSGLMESNHWVAIYVCLSVRNVLLMT